MRWLALAVALSGCAGTISSERAEGWHEALNVSTDVIDPLYEGAVVICRVAEENIVRREDSTREEDLTAIADIRRACTPAFATFEELRSTQAKARELVDEARESGAQAAIATAAAMIAKLADAGARANESWRDLREVLSAILAGG